MTHTLYHFTVMPRCWSGIVSAAAGGHSVPPVARAAVLFAALRGHAQGGEESHRRGWWVLAAPYLWAQGPERLTVPSSGLPAIKHWEPAEVEGMADTTPGTGACLDRHSKTPRSDPLQGVGGVRHLAKIGLSAKAFAAEGAGSITKAHFLAHHQAGTHSLGAGSCGRSAVGAGVQIRTLIGMLYDVRWFLAVSAIIMLGGAHTFLVLLQDSDVSDNPAYASPSPRWPRARVPSSPAWG